MASAISGSSACGFGCSTPTSNLIDELIFYSFATRNHSLSNTEMKFPENLLELSYKTLQTFCFLRKISLIISIIYLVSTRLLRICIASRIDFGKNFYDFAISSVFKFTRVVHKLTYLLYVTIGIFTLIFKSNSVFFLSINNRLICICISIF